MPRRSARSARSFPPRRVAPAAVFVALLAAACDNGGAGGGPAPSATSIRAATATAATPTDATAAPSAGGAASPRPSAGPGDRVVVVGAAPAVTAEIADTDRERSRGLMDRAALPAGRGMLFVFSAPTTAAFYMYRTRIPLSIAFIMNDRVVAVREMTPCPSATPRECPIYAPDAAYTSALEAPTGTFTRIGVGPGDPVRFLPQ
jgi:uncharacterized protein